MIKADQQPPMKRLVMGIISSNRWRPTLDCSLPGFVVEEAVANGASPQMTITSGARKRCLLRGFQKPAMQKGSVAEITTKASLGKESVVQPTRFALRELGVKLERLQAARSRVA